MEIIRAAARHAASTAVRQPHGVSCSYGKLLDCSEAISTALQKVLPSTKGSRDGPRIGIYAEPGLQYIAGTWSSWMSGGVAVPLAVSHPPAELDYVIRDAGVSAVISSPSGHEKLKDICHAAGASLHVVEDAAFLDSSQTPSASTVTAVTTTEQTDSSSSSSYGLPFAMHHDNSSSSSDSGALIVYTSGTTGRPKGALHTHGSLLSQVRCLTSAWQWSQNDVMLHALPLHHVHGVINGLYCAQYCGATINLMPKFSPAAVWEELMSGGISVFMAVPTMYSYLLSHYHTNMKQQQQAAAAAAVQQLRLTVSGSAAAPVALLQQWRKLSGQQLLERYGMTETGMILSNPYKGERRPGFVGVPLPGVEVKIAQQQQQQQQQQTGGGNRATSAGSSSDQGSSSQGGLAVRGPMLFREYWGRPQAAADAFDEEGYFLTGDTVSLEGQPPYYRILGRTSVDIIKSGGYKLSALDIEGVLLHHADVAEAAVLGVPDEKLGQLVAALIYPKSAASKASSSSSPSAASGLGSSEASRLQEDLIQQLQKHCQAELPSYAAPRQWRVLDQPLPRNAMGKINKKELLKAFFTGAAATAA